MKEVIEIFEHTYDVNISKDGVKKLHEHYSLFEPETIKEALNIVINRYKNANEAFAKIGGVCYNLETKYIDG